MLQRSTVEGTGRLLHSCMGYRFLSRSEQITSRFREPDPQLLEHCGKICSVISERKSDETTTSHPYVLTKPQSPTCHVICAGQAAISQRWAVCGRSRLLQDNSFIFIPPESTQVTSLVCSPEPQVTEHYRHKVLYLTRCFHLVQTNFNNM